MLAPTWSLVCCDRIGIGDLDLLDLVGNLKKMKVSVCCKCCVYRRLDHCSVLEYIGMCWLGQGVTAKQNFTLEYSSTCPGNAVLKYISLLVSLIASKRKAEMKIVSDVATKMCGKVPLAPADQPYRKSWFPPHDMDAVLSLPVEIFPEQLHVESEVHFSQQQAYLDYCKTYCDFSAGFPDGKLPQESGTYFFPRQTLGPSENGLLASFTSVHVGSSHRSGLNWKGS